MVVDGVDNSAAVARLILQWRDVHRALGTLGGLPKEACPGPNLVDIVPVFSLGLVGRHGGSLVDPGNASQLVSS